MTARRPYVPLAVKVAVSEKLVRLLGHLPYPETSMRFTSTRASLAFRLKFNLNLAARLKGLPDGNSFHLDHDPPLASRRKYKRWNGSQMAVYYSPPPNDPAYLFYLTKEDHRTKTLIRGYHGQYSDIALIKRERRRLRKKAKPKRHWPSRPFPKRRKQ